MISKTLKEIASNYIEAKAGPMTSSKLAELIRNAAKNILKPVRATKVVAVSKQSQLLISS